MLRNSLTSGSLIIVLRAPAMELDAEYAAALASITATGISLGPLKTPQTLIPGTEVATGSKDEDTQNLSLSTSIPSFSAIDIVSGDVSRPTERTTISNSSATFSPFSFT